MSFERSGPLVSGVSPRANFLSWQSHQRGLRRSPIPRASPHQRFQYQISIVVSHQTGLRSRVLPRLPRASPWAGVYKRSAFLHGRATTAISTEERVIGRSPARQVVDLSVTATRRRNLHVAEHSIMVAALTTNFSNSM
jgi:hypothetical protein